ncbi:uncharacterized protein LOC134851468 isoform X2 [Symsagittifera roscoffensis]|uniref:uncharacterized protein LOC134851468 isoform X2 n=1 Tax=Symsagittifera roscoffensis TaxID=84072 RepID=UPI00307C5413
MDYDIGKPRRESRSPSVNTNTIHHLNSSSQPRHSSSGGSLFPSTHKGEVQKEWRSATDGSVITSSAKVGIAVAQQRAPPAVPPPPHSSAEQTTSAAVAAAASSYYASQAQISLHNSLINASAGQATLDLNSLQQQLLYNQTMANLPLSLPTGGGGGASLQPTIPFPVTYWPAMPLPSAAAAVGYQQALNNLLRSSTSLSNAAAANAAVAAAASAYPSLLQQPGAAAAALSALGAAANHLPMSSSASFDSFLGAAVVANSQLRNSSDWSDLNLRSSSPSPSLNHSGNTSMSIAAGHQVDPISTASLIAHEMGKVYAFNRKAEAFTESLRSTHDTSLPLSVVTTTSASSSFGKTLGYVRRPDPYSENNSFSREPVKSDVPKINLPTKSVTIPAESLKELNQRPPSNSSVSSETQKSYPHSSTPPHVHSNSNHSNDFLLPAKWRCKTSFPKTEASGTDLLTEAIPVKQPTPLSDSLVQSAQQIDETDFKSSSSTFRSATPKSVEIHGVPDHLEAKHIKAPLMSPLLVADDHTTVKPPATRGRPRDTYTSSATNYIKCIEDVVHHSDRYTSEERRSELWDFCKRVSEHEFPDPARSSVSPGSMRSLKSPGTDSFSTGRNSNSGTAAFSISAANRSSNFAFDPSEFGSASSLNSNVNNHPTSYNIGSSATRKENSVSPGRIVNRDSTASVASTAPGSDDDDDDDDDDDESVSSDSTICPESPPLVISYTKETLNEFCTRQYQSLLADVEQPLKQVLASEDEDTAAKRKLIVLEQRVKRKLKMVFAGFEKEEKRARMEEGNLSSVPSGGSGTMASSSSSRLSVGSSSVYSDRRLNPQTTSAADSTSQMTPQVGNKSKSPSSTKVLQRKTPCQTNTSVSNSANRLSTNNLNQSEANHHHKHDRTPFEFPQRSPVSTVQNSNTANYSHSQTSTSQGSSTTRLQSSKPVISSTSSNVAMSETLKVATAVAEARRSVHLTNDDLVSGQRVLLRQSDGLYAPGKLIAMKPPDVYGILVDGARGSRPQIFAYEDLVDRAVLEIVPRTKSAIPKGTKVCAHYSKSFTELHPGTVSISNTKTLPHAVKIDFDDGDESIVNLTNVRVLSSLFNSADYSILSATYSPTQPQSGGTSSSRKVSIWKWERKCLTETPLSKNIKAFYSSISKSDAVVNKDDFVAFHNSAAHVPGSSRRPYVGRVINFFETSSGECIVKVSWFYRTEETKQGVERTLPKNALLKSSHCDELDIQTISHKVEVLDEEEYASHNHNIYKAAQAKGTFPDNLFVCAGTYDHVKGATYVTYKKPKPPSHLYASINSVSPVAATGRTNSSRFEQDDISNVQSQHTVKPTKHSRHTLNSN